MFRKLLDERNITCYSLSKRSGVSYTAINELYRGERDIGECSFKNVVAMANALEISLDEILKGCSCRATIPESFAKYFWDTDIGELDLLKHKHYIIPRLLEYGGYEGFSFVWNSYTYEEIKDVAMKSRNLGSKTAYSLMNHFKLKENQMAYFTIQSGDWRQ